MTTAVLITQPHPGAATEAVERALQVASEAEVELVAQPDELPERTFPFEALLEGDEPPNAAERYAAAVDSVRPEDMASIVYTSGTTGEPKGAMLTFGNFFWSAFGSMAQLGVHEEDRWLACLPLFHVGGLSIMMR